MNTISRGLVLAAALNSAPAVADPWSEFLASVLSGAGSVLEAAWR